MHLSSEEGQVRLGLRERKKAKTRSAIQEHAMRLFSEQGYQATTIEQIAEAAEISKSTFFRYFPTKEDVVLRDDFDQAFLDALRAQPEGISALEAVRRAAQSVFKELSEELAQTVERNQLIRTVPELRARMLDEFAQTVHLFAVAVAERYGRGPEELAVRTFAGAIVGVILSIWMLLEAGDALTDLPRLVDAGIGYLEAGLPL